MILTTVGMSFVLVAVITLVSVGAVGIHPGRVEAGLSGVLVRMIALVSMVAPFVAVGAPLGVRVSVVPV